MAKNNNTFFTYPLLCNYNDDYNNIKFIAGSTGKMTKTNKKSTIETYVEIEDEEINKLLNSRELKIITKVFCPSTKYRNIFEIQRGIDKIEINNRDINKRVEFTTYIIANKDINNFTSYNFNDDYKGMKFEIEKGSIIAVGKEESIFFEKDIDDLTKVNSIIKIRDLKKDNEPMSVVWDDDNIKINLSTTDYNIYCRYSEYCVPIVNSMIIIPSIMYVLDQLASEEIDINDVIDKKWYRVLSKKISIATGREFDLNYIRSHGSFEIIQKLFDTPIHEAMKEIEIKYGGESR